MSRAAANGGPYGVHCSQVIAQALREVQKEAEEQGRGPQALAAIRRILQRLSHDPMNFGEPLYRLPVLRMQIRQGAVRPLFIDFAVCEDQPQVFIRGIKLLPQ
jgi:hypothetical protein